jgi:hypothetical protein
VEKNSVEGTAKLFLDWINLSPAAKSSMVAQSKPCYELYFSIESAARKLVATLAAGTK